MLGKELLGVLACSMLSSLYMSIVNHQKNDIGRQAISCALYWPYDMDILPDVRATLPLF